MKNLIFPGLSILLLSCATPRSKPPVNPFVDKSGCFLLYNLKTDALEKSIGDACEKRSPACSTFKVPLAVMAFDAGILKDEKEVLKWDGEKRMIDAWNKDHSAESWMTNSVVWFSQRLTPKLGEKKVKKYLEDFDYGNKDISPGLTTAWLNGPNDPKGSLAISPKEQIEFLKKLWRNELPASRRAQELAKKLTYLETSPRGFRLSGKTGSNIGSADKKRQLGWFIAHVTNGDEEYLAVTNFADLKPVETKLFGGQRAKEITKLFLMENNLW